MQIDTSASRDPIGHLLAGTIDLGIVNVMGREPKIGYKKLFDDEMVAVLNLWSARPYLNPRELCGVRVTRRGLRRVWYAAFRREERRPACIDKFITVLMRQGRDRGVAVESVSGSQEPWQ
ncbi:MAG: hypothetical protein V2A71_06025 [Candidatus Eisenbacteria bacterium]